MLQGRLGNGVFPIGLAAPLNTEGFAGLMGATCLTRSSSPVCGRVSVAWSMLQLGLGCSRARLRFPDLSSGPGLCELGGTTEGAMEGAGNGLHWAGLAVRGEWENHRCPGSQSRRNHWCYFSLL